MLRKRVPFAGEDDDETAPQIVLDDTEQNELVDRLRQENTQTTARALLLLDAVLVCSVLLQLVYLLKDSKASPLLAIFPPASDANVDPDPPLPCPSLFTLLALALHANLALHLHGGDIRLSFSPVLSYTHTYALAAVAPCLSLFLGRSWQATAWAAAPVALIALAHSVHGTLREGDEALAELEALKYSAPGA